MVLLKNYSIKHTSFKNLSNVHRKALEPLIYILKEIILMMILSILMDFIGIDIYWVTLLASFHILFKIGFSLLLDTYIWD